MLETDDPVAYLAHDAGRVAGMCVREVPDKRQLYFVAKTLRRETTALVLIKAVVQVGPQQCRPSSGLETRSELLDHDLLLPVGRVARQCTARRTVETGNTKKAFSLACAPFHRAWEKPLSSITGRYFLDDGVKALASETTLAKGFNLESAWTPVIKQLNA